MVVKVRGPCNVVSLACSLTRSRARSCSASRRWVFAPRACARVLQRCHGQTVKKKKTNVVKGNLNPTWNETLDFPVQDVRIQALHFTVFDKDMFGSDFM